MLGKRISGYSLKMARALGGGRGVFQLDRNCLDSYLLTLRDEDLLTVL